MKIGITLNDSTGLEGNVCEHFGQCSHFLIAEIKDGVLSQSQVVENGAQHGGGGCQAVNEILKYDIECVISGGMGMGAQQKFANAGVKIFGYDGKVKDAIEAFIKNALPGLSACAHGHEHHHEHGQQHSSDEGGCH